MNRESNEKVEELLKEFNKDAEEDGLFDIDIFLEDDESENL